MTTRAPPDDPTRRFDLVTMGRAIVDIYGEQAGCRLEDVSSFAKYVGGCPANIAIGAARLGLRAAMITRVGDEQHGRFIREALAREGVDVSHVRTDPRRATGVAFLAIRDKETFPLLHYRDDCADMAISPADYSADFIGSARALLVSGSHLSTPAAMENVGTAIGHARERRTRVVFDIDYRPLFWGLAQRDLGESRYVESAAVTAATQRFVDRCDMIVGTDEEIRIAGGADDTHAALVALRARTRAVIVLKRGPHGCVAFPDAIPARIDDGLAIDGFAVDFFNVVGAGDGFMAGLLYGWLRGRPLAEACRLGNACGALVVSRHGCSPASPTRTELDWFLAHADARPDLHRDRTLASLHRATTRRRRPAGITAFECDARPAHRERFTTLVAEAVRELGSRVPGIGIVLAHPAGETALQRVAAQLDWIVRRIDDPARPGLAFEDDQPAGVLLRHWPLELVVKCAVRAVTEVRDAARVLRDERLRELYLACQHYGHELLLDLSPCGEETLDVLETLRSGGIVADWWQVPAAVVHRHAAFLRDMLHASAPHCRGVLAKLPGAAGGIAADIAAVRDSGICHGVVIGHELFDPFWPRFAEGRAGDAETIDAVRHAIADALVETTHAS